MIDESFEQAIPIRPEALAKLWDSLLFPAAVMFNADFVITELNRQFLEQTGLASDQVVGHLFADVFNWASPTPHLPAGLSGNRVWLTVAGREVMEFQCFLFRLDLGEGGVANLALLSGGAVRTRNLLQQFALTFLKDENLGVILMQPDFRVSDISPLACRVLGVSQEEVIGYSMDEVFRGAPGEHQMLKQMVIEEIAVHNHPLRRMRGDERWELLMDANLLRDEREKLLGAYVIFKDVSNLRSLEEQVQRSDRLSMIGQIAAGTAHEIRNPLTAIKGFLQMFKKTLREKQLDKEYGYTEIMLTEIDRINNLVSEFLLLSKHKDIVYDLVDLGAVLREIMPIVRSEALLHGVVLQFDAESPLPRVVADREMLKQVFLNICKNGIEAMKRGGTLAIGNRIERENGSGRWVHVDIHDTGSGLSPSVVDKMFDPFVTTKEGGTGLGLSVCQRIIHDMGGHIRAVPREKGTTFTVSIPCPMEERVAKGDRARQYADAD
ncbi:ATP-binding protein [Paenibacillus sp. SYP-B4298]|uniref:ATP-binding protein n=1 Tax=Paenibacillus sp. SYP-B4298 TaxID=2996034 RepID=UPI0022DE118C|nr:ATP-binding protein [Paenibacillus sp. SYP-B4298]